MSNPNEVVKRYDFYIQDSWGQVNIEEEQNKNGDWVKYSSYQSLELENKRLKDSLKEQMAHNCDGYECYACSKEAQKKAEKALGDGGK